MDDAGLPPQTEDECVEVGGSTLAALLLEPLHQPQAHSGLLFGVVKHAPAAIASRNSMGSYNGEDDDGPTKTTVVLSHARGTDPSLATSVAPEEARVVGLWVARPAAPPVPTLRDVAAVEKLRETARDAILLVVTCEGASARYRCFVGGHAVRPCRVRVRTLTHDSRREYEACPDGVCGASWPALRSATAAPFDASTATAAFARDRGLLDGLLADGARLGAEADALERESRELRAALAAARADAAADAPAMCLDDLRDAASAALEADDAALRAARAAAADDDAAAAENAEIAATVPPTPHNSLTALDEADATDGERTATPADLCALDPDALERTASPADLTALDAPPPPPAAFMLPPRTAAEADDAEPAREDVGSEPARPVPVATAPRVAEDVAALAQLQRDMDSDDDAAPAQIAEPPGR
ncbi:unnamed protein product [Pelagomonas calceolata]|uniref:Uncharacterized protein n=1 Tax=Pelagomonas calceolata TaxID=35677 RepID=A0A7S3ZQ11_9STRA|nr:unnamed protein product [Pelagomonas calceolata]